MEEEEVEGGRCFTNNLSDKGGLSAQDFVPVRTLGHGDIGTVFLVTFRGNLQHYAMKVMEKEVLQKKGVKRAITEKRVLSMVHHPFLPTLYAHFESPKYVFFVMDFCCGRDLNILRHKQPDKKCPEFMTRFYAAEIVVALEYLHTAGIIYRDLKPENILIQSDGHIMLTDFDLSLVVERNPDERVKHTKGWGSIFTCFSPGAAQDAPSIKEEKERKQQGNTMYNPIPAMNSTRAEFPLPFKHVWQRKKKRLPSCRSHSFVGTEEYVAPEVLWGTGHDFAVDWWTLGIFLYEMVYGKTPFKGQNRKETFYNILCIEPPDIASPSPLNNLIRQLLVKNPDLRLGSVSGAEAIKKHPFFKGTAWKHLHAATRPPYVPPLVHVDNKAFEKLPMQNLLAGQDNASMHYHREQETKGGDRLEKEVDQVEKVHKVDAFKSREQEVVEDDEKENTHTNTISNNAKGLENALIPKLIPCQESGVQLKWKKGVGRASQIIEMVR